jgi:spermidine synthase
MAENGKVVHTLSLPSTLKSGWFTETETFWPGQKFSLALEEFSPKALLFHEHSDFQEVLVFRSAQYGNVLCLDGVIQLTERDEFSYHEMMTHLPLCSHARPRRVLIVGGGDGGILREVCRHECVEKIVLVEIDPTVIRVCRQHFGQSTAVAFDDPRLSIVHQDAAAYLAEHLSEHEVDYFDVRFCFVPSIVFSSVSWFPVCHSQALSFSLTHTHISLSATLL